jgi:hypothetical protein
MPAADPQHYRTTPIPGAIPERRSSVDRIRRPLSDATKRVAPRLDPTVPFELEPSWAAEWEALEDTPFDRVGFNAVRDGFLREAGCSADGTPGVAKNFVMTDAFWRDDGPNASTLAAAFLDEANCPGARELPESIRAKLREIARRIPTHAPDAAEPLH